MKKYKLCQLPPNFLTLLFSGKKLIKSDVAWAIHHVDHWNNKGFFPDTYKREEIVNEFNRMFNLNIK